MAGFISNPRVRAPDGPWEKWRDAIVLADAGSTKLADGLLREILEHPKVPNDPRKMVEERQRRGWTRDL
jgi:hypothetical protein